MSTLDYELLIRKAVDNIQQDRDQAKDLLNDLIQWASQSGDRHKEVTISMAKYLETMQRSNEQLVKIGLSAKKKEESLELSDAEKDALFGEMQGSKK